MCTYSAYFFLIGCLILTNPAAAQQDSASDVTSALYESISFSENQAPDYEIFKSLLIDNARLITVSDTAFYMLTPDDYAKIMTQQRESGKITAFEEKELHRKTERFGNILHVFSTYQTYFETPAGPDSARGINSIQLIKENDEWKAASIIWYEENEEHPLPERYLPPNKN